MHPLQHIKICTLNIGGFSPGSLLCLDKYCDEEKFDLLKIQETGKREDVNLCNMTHIRDDNKAKNRGTMVYTKNEHSLTKLKSLNSLSKQIDTTWGMAIMHNKRYIVGSVYLKHGYIHGIKELNIMLKEAYELQTKLKASGVIVSGDFNARHTAWGDRLSDTYGKALFDQLDFEKYTIHSTKSPTFISANGSSLIDFFLISNNLDIDSITITTDDEVHLGTGAPFRGHLPVIAKISFKTSPIISTKKRKEIINIDNVDWPKWSAEVEQILLVKEKEIDDCEDPHILWQILNSSIQAATMKQAKVKISTPYSKPYWNDELSMLAKDLRLARKAYNKRNTDYNKDRLVAAKEIFDEKRKKACNDFIMDRAKNLNSVQAQKFWKKFNALFKKRNEQHVEPLIDSNGIIISENKQIEREMYSTFFEGKHLQLANFDNEFYNEIQKIYEEILEEIEDNTKYNNSTPEHLNCEISIKEMKDIIKLQKPGSKSLDKDNFHPKMFKFLGSKVMLLMKKLFNLCLSTGIWVWEEAEVIFLKKEGKETYDLPGSYRPISITSYIGKFYEKILVNRILKHLNIEDLHDEDQEGFFKKRNTIRYLNRLHLNIQEDIMCNQTSIGLFIDLEKAFDSVWQQGLIVKLYKMGIKGSILKIINTFLRGRKLSLLVNGFKGPQRTGDVGVPQGSVLSPVLFKIYLMDFGQELENTEGIMKLKFADDGTIKVSKPNTQDCIISLNNVLTTMNNWCYKWRMVINCSPNKTEAICFNTAEGDSNLVPETFNLGEKTVKLVKKTKVLGLIIDEKLSFKPHSDYVYNKLVYRWVSIAKYSNKNWGFNQAVMTLLLKTIFLSCLYYAGHIWINRKNLQDISKLWYKMIKSSIGAVFNISQNVAEVILGLPPLEITNKINRVKHLLKLNINKTDHDPLAKYFNNLLNIQTNNLIPTEVKVSIKEVFQYLNWRIDKGDHKMNIHDLEIIRSNSIEKFFQLSLPACSYTQNIMKKFTEYLWEKTLTNICLGDGKNIVPAPTCKPMVMPTNVNRKSEVLIMSLFYDNNLMNDFLYNRSLVESPLCPHCQSETQTPYHAMVLCEGINQSYRNKVKQALKSALGEEKALQDCSTTLLNASRCPNFLTACHEILVNYNFRQEIHLRIADETNENIE